jgi:hypothetical protein
MSVLPLTFEDKVDSPELVAWLATFGAEKKLTAAEINLIRDAINELKESFDSGMTEDELKSMIYVYLTKPKVVHEYLDKAVKQSL